MLLGMLVLFLIITGVDYYRGITFSCGCGLPFMSTEIGLLHILQTFLMIAIAVFIMLNYEVIGQKVSSK